MPHVAPQSESENSGCRSIKRNRFYSYTKITYIVPSWLRSVMSETTVVKKCVLALVAQGSEEMELVITVDVLRRCNIDVTVALVLDEMEGASEQGLVVQCSRHVNVRADTTLQAYLQQNTLTNDMLPDALILPGGLEGSKIMSKVAAVGSLLRCYENSEKIVSAICAAPTVFISHGNLFAGRRLTCYPALKQLLIKEGYDWQEPHQSHYGRVIVDGNLITSMGPATTFDFALTIAAVLTSLQEAEKVAINMLYKWPY
ncbi:protein dj-1beta-like [Anopheles bellator]|uniref:protein dj-1beta-like n=1 Tax=Anopheles bellator TaxID=139047 RepID=UPI0026497B52|nr:protein dj-1beta-like [Anopheles bellator]